MKSRLRLTPPKQRLAQRSGSRMRPMSLAAGSKIATPSCPSPPPQPHQRLPSVSQRIPSGIPSPALTNTHPLASFVPPSTTSKTLISRGVAPLTTTYSLDSSVEKQRPLGRGTSPVAIVVAEDAEGRIAEPHGVVGLADDVVRRIERLSLVAVRQHGDGAVVLGACHAPRVVLAGHETSLAVARVAVCVVRGLAEDAHRTRLFLPLHHPVVGDVAPEEEASIAEPDRAFRPPKARGQPLDGREVQPVFREARIEPLHSRIRVPDRLTVPTIHEPSPREELGLRRRPPEFSTPATPGSGSRRVPGGSMRPVPTKRQRTRRAQMEPSRTGAASACRVVERPRPAPAATHCPPPRRGACVTRADAIQVALDVIPRQESAMSETPKLLLQKDGPIGWIIFNQPEKRNAVSLEMWQLMPEYVHDLVTDDAIRVVILRGAGDQAFVAGADISQFKERRRNMADQEEY